MQLTIISLSSLEKSYLKIVIGKDQLLQVITSLKSNDDDDDDDDDDETVFGADKLCDN